MIDITKCKRLTYEQWDGNLYVTTTGGYLLAYSFTPQSCKLVKVVFHSSGNTLHVPQLVPNDPTTWGHLANTFIVGDSSSGLYLQFLPTLLIYERNSINTVGNGARYLFSNAALQNFYDIHYVVRNHSNV